MRHKNLAAHTSVGMFWLMIGVWIPEFALAQAADPFETGATNLVTNLTTLATPIAVLLIMALGVSRSGRAHLVGMADRRYRRYRADLRRATHGDVRERAIRGNRRSKSCRRKNKDSQRTSSSWRPPGHRLAGVCAYLALLFNMVVTMEIFLSAKNPPSTAAGASHPRRMHVALCPRHPVLRARHALVPNPDAVARREFAVMGRQQLQPADAGCAESGRASARRTDAVPVGRHEGQATAGEFMGEARCAGAAGAA